MGRSRARGTEPGRHIAPFAAKFGNGSRLVRPAKRFYLLRHTQWGQPLVTVGPSSPYPRPRRITFMIVSMRPIVQHIGQPFHKKRTAGSRMTDSHSALLIVRIAT